MSSIKKTAIIITIITLISKILGFGREIVLAYFYGTSYIVDAYIMAITIPTIIFGWLSTMAISYTPIYTEIHINDGYKKSISFSNNMISIVLIFSLISIVICFLLNNKLVSMLAPGFQGETFNLTSNFLNISIFSLVFSSILQIFTAYLNCNNKFIESSFSMLFFSSTQIIFIIVSGTINLGFLIYGYLMATIMQFIYVYIFSYKVGYRFKFDVKITEEIKKSFRLVVPIFISNALIQINSFVDKSFASSLAVGSISALNYANILRIFIYTIFTISITTLIYPLLSKYIAERDMSSVKEIFSKSINLIIILFVPITLGIILLATPAIEFVYQRGEFSSSSTLLTSSAFIMYSIGLLPLAFTEVITKVFYSMQDTKSVMYISTINVILNVLLNIIFIKPLKHSGLALATSLSSMITLPVLFFILRKKIGPLGFKNSAILLIKSFISTVVMGAIVYFVYKYLSIILDYGKLGILLSLSISVLVGGIVYFVIMIILKVKEIDFFIDIIHSIFKFLKHNILKK